ncbi:CPBP family intramembrane glutamic endopeptidase [Paenibacillus sp. FSL R7-0331]|uniref:CPBP family intramembrane glutamic endopeptidase n=1 Tax=Paenibacillus sp. FSL R7-0331 TaxID=1536773 RepID=UPI000693B0FB|nr:CPBP family intramembrane glutamic endopeptidase [Paenibacillus sp. FSL R7-0331]
MRRLDEVLRVNPLFAGAKASRLKINLYVLVPLYFVLWMGSLTAGRWVYSGVSYSLVQSLGLGESTIQEYRKFIICSVQLVLFYLWINIVEKRPLRSVGFHTAKPLRAYWTGFLTGFGAISAVTAILLSLGMVQVEAHHWTALTPLAAVIALGWMVQSAAEELAVRGWLIPMLAKESTPAAAILLSSVIFGFFHLFSSGVTVLSFINLILSGLFFAGYAIVTKHIWGVCGMHFAWNVTLGNLYGFPVSGFADNGRTLLGMNLTGPAFFTGGAFGPEGGAVTTFVLMLGIIIVAILWCRQQAPLTSTN